MAKNQVVHEKPHLPVDDYADRYAGEETLVAPEHRITPVVSILQGLSPQVKRNNVAYVEGAQVGMIFLSGFHKPLVDGDAGIVFQPCLFQTPWEVRTPKESGAANFIGRYETPQPEWSVHHDPKGYAYYKTPEGNVAHQVHIHVGLLHIDDQVLPYAIKFSGTGIFISKQWNGTIGGRRTDSGKPAARFTYTYRMRVKSQTNAFGEWGQWSISADGRATNEEMDIAHELVKQIRSGERTVDAGEPDQQPGADPDAPF